MKTMRFAKRTSITAVALAVILGLGLGATQSAQAQTFTLLHVFTGTPDGSYPLAGFAQDAAGHPHRPTQQGGGSGGRCPNKDPAPVRRRARLKLAPTRARAPVDTSTESSAAQTPP